MIYVPVIFFAMAAMGGMTLLTIKLQGKGLPLVVILGHGIVAAAGLVTLIINVHAHTANNLMNVSLILFIIIALGGFSLVLFQLLKKPLPIALIFIHGLGAVASFSVLLISIIR